jgi:hypothetical protein
LGCDDFIAFSIGEVLEDVGVDTEETEVNDCVEPLLFERDEDEDENEIWDDLEPCRTCGRRGVELSVGLARGIRREGVPGYERVFEIVGNIEGLRCSESSPTTSVSSKR